MKYYNPFTDEILESAEPQTKKFFPLFDKINLEENSSFSDNLQIFWDATSLSNFKKCPRYYHFTNIQGWQLDPKPSPLGWGIGFHTCMQVWNELLFSSFPKDLALFRVTKLAGLLGEYITPGRTERTKETLVRAVVWYCLQFWDDPLITQTHEDGTPAVEVSFAFELTEIDGVKFYWCGHFDKVVEFLGDIFISDYKTARGELSSDWAKQFKPSTQMSGYTMAGHVLSGTCAAVPRLPKGMLIEGVQLGVNFNRYNRFPITVTELEVEEFFLETTHWLATAKRYAESGVWPANEASCSNYGGCVFQKICSSSPPARERMLKGNFIQSFWDPKRSR